MHKVLFVFISFILGVCFLAAYDRYGNEENANATLKSRSVNSSATESVKDTDTLGLIRRDIMISEIYRLVDSIDKYGFEEGARKYHKDTLNLTDEELQALKECGHEIALTLKFKVFLNPYEQ